MTTADNFNPEPLRDAYRADPVSYRTLARKAGLALNTVAGMIEGTFRRRPHHRSIVLLAKALDVDPAKCIVPARTAESAGEDAA